MAEGETWAQYVKRLEVISDYYLISFFFSQKSKNVSRILSFKKPSEEIFPWQPCLETFFVFLFFYINRK